MQKNDSQLFRTAPHPVLRVVLVIAFFLLSLLAVDAHAHGCLHEDAAHPDHQCALTLLAQGHIEITRDPEIPVRSISFMPVADLFDPSTAFDPASRLPPSCGPPVA